MRKQERFLNIVGRTAEVLFAGSLVLGSAAAQPASSRDLLPTPVAGESWLHHLARSFDETSMGKTGRLGPPEAVTSETASSRTGGAEPRLHTASFREEGTVVLRGADLYRMNCRGCHGENGTGAPPEINSVINPVRATSAAVIMEQMKARGAEMSRSDVLKLAQQSRTMLLDRLHHGGQDMPAFPHLSEAEVSSLIAYLRQMAGVRGAGNAQLAVRVERLRVGEHIAKSTCHICHSAAGPNPTLQQLYEGAIPPLSTLPLRASRADFVRKVTQGAPIRMGAPPQVLRGRMPVFYYLSEEEAADVYLYLTNYPPYEFAVLDAATMGPTTGPDSGTDARFTRIGDPPHLTEASQRSSAVLAADSAEHTVNLAEPNNAQLATLTVLMGLLAALVMCLGFWFTVCELRRLSGESDGSTLRRKELAEGVTPQLDPEMAA